MKLSRLVLNPLSRQVGRAVADVQQLHAMVMAGFPGERSEGARARVGVLHRLEVDPQGGGLVLYIQSSAEPEWSGFPSGALVQLEGRANPEVRELSELGEIVAGGVARFRLRANPTRKIDTKSVAGQRRHGRRVPHRDDGRCIEWLLRKGRDHGFELVRADSGQVAVNLIREPVRRGRRGSGRIAFEGVRFDGLLRIVDSDLFSNCVRAGIGPGKAYGFGLLSFSMVRGAPNPAVEQR